MRPIFVGIVLLCVFSVPPDAGIFAWQEANRGKADQVNSVVECTISLGLHPTYVELRIADQKQIKEIVQDPLEKARLDPDPAKYKVLGSVSMKRNDGSEYRCTLFSPWGRFSRDRKIYIADFSAMRKALKESLTDAIGQLD